LRPIGAASQGREILALRQKLEMLREQQWGEPVTMQQERIQLLTKLRAAQS